jgi:hypothetical protein
MARAFDGLGHQPLMSGVQTAAAAGQNLALRVDVAAKLVIVLVIRLGLGRSEFIDALGAGRTITRAVKATATSTAARATLGLGTGFFNFVCFHGFSFWDEAYAFQHTRTAKFIRF